MKTCTKCKQLLPDTDFRFAPRTKDKLQCWCNKCAAADRLRVKAEKAAGTYIPKVRKARLTSEEREQRKEELREYNKVYRANNKEKIAVKKKQYVDSLKHEGILHYGGKCSCCGETIEEFLTLEHLVGRDKTKKRHTGKKAWAQAKSEGYPDIYTVLCFNCNCAKGAFGICPHEVMKAKSNCQC